MAMSVPTLTKTWSAGQVVTASDLNGNFTTIRDYLNSYGPALNGANTWTAAQTFSAAVTVSAGGITVTGNSTITGTLGGLTGLTVASGGAAITGNSTITGTLGGLTGLTVASGGITVTGNSTITGTLSGVTTLTATSVAGTLTTAAQPNITSVGTLTSLTVTTLTPTTVAGAANFTGTPTFAAGLTVNAQNTNNIYLGTDGTTAKTVSDTRGWLIIPYVTSKPSVNLAATANATSAMCYDPSNKKMYMYSGSGTTWHEVLFT